MMVPLAFLPPIAAFLGFGTDYRVNFGSRGNDADQTVAFRDCVYGNTTAEPCVRYWWNPSGAPPYNGSNWMARINDAAKLGSLSIPGLSLDNFLPVPLSQHFERGVRAVFVGGATRQKFNRAKIDAMTFLNANSQETILILGSQAFLRDLHCHRAHRCIRVQCHNVWKNMRINQARNVIIIVLTPSTKSGCMAPFSQTDWISTNTRLSSLPTGWAARARRDYAMAHSRNLLDAASGNDSSLTFLCMSQARHDDDYTSIVVSTAQLILERRRESRQCNTTRGHGILISSRPPPEGLTMVVARDNSC